MKMNGGEKRYALLLAANDSEYAKKVYGGYFNVFVAAFGEEGERWDLFRVVDGDFPDLSQLHLYDGFVISGSPHDSYGDEQWILKLCFLLRTLDAMQKKVLGICFGHQVLCRALGGKVGKACTGWDIGLRTIKLLVKEIWPAAAADDDDHDDCGASLSIIECHQDEVLEVPPGAQVIACSDKTGVEMFMLGPHILGIQGHPEYTKDILYSIVDRLLNSHVIEEEFAEKAKGQLEVEAPDRINLQKICKNFLKNQNDVVRMQPHFHEI